MTDPTQQRADAYEKERNVSGPGQVPADLDLFCLGCGYNLRGLCGDPRCCPECGTNNRVSDLTIPSHVIAKQL